MASANMTLFQEIYSCILIWNSGLGLAYDRIGLKESLQHWWRTCILKLRTDSLGNMGPYALQKVSSGWAWCHQMAYSDNLLHLLAGLHHQACKMHHSDWMICTYAHISTLSRALPIYPRQAMYRHYSSILHAPTSTLSTASSTSPCSGCSWILYSYITHQGNSTSQAQALKMIYANITSKHQLFPYTPCIPNIQMSPFPIAIMFRLSWECNWTCFR